MKPLLSRIMLLIVCLTFVTAAQANAEDGCKKGEKPPCIEAPANPAAMTPAQWKSYGDRLETALASDNEGVRLSVLRLTIQYGEYLDMSRASVYDVVHLYRNHNDERVRRMAVVALGHMENDWAIAFLERSVQFEKVPCIKQTMQAVVAEYRAAHEATPMPPDVLQVGGR